MGFRRCVVCLLAGVFPVTVACSQTEHDGPPEGYHMKLSLDEEFAGSVIDRSLWSNNLAGRNSRDAPVAERTLYGNGEREVYVDKDFIGLHIDPFTVHDHMLTIVAAPLSSTAKKRVQEDVMRGAQRNNPVLHGLAYSSGLINARGRFAQQYGYFEARMRWTLGKGIWPAFWLLPADGKWPPEIDVIEALGHQPSVIYSSLHPRGNPHGITKTVSITGTGADFHTYGVMWLPDRTDFYVDGQKSATLAATPDMARPMYPVINLAIGGYWPKDPDQTTPLPAKLDVKFVRAWTFSDGMVPEGAPTGH